MVAFSGIRITDHVNPLHNILREATQETPESLIRDWQRRQREGR